VLPLLFDLIYTSDHSTGPVTGWEVTVEPEVCGTLPARDFNGIVGAAMPSRFLGTLPWTRWN